MMAELERRLTNRTIMQRFEFFFVGVFMVTLAICLSLGGYWLFIDTNAPIKSMFVETLDKNGIATEEFKRGELMLIIREICYDSSEILFFTRSFVNRKNKLSYIMPSGPAQVDEGCRRSINRVQIPDYIEPGEYDYIVSVHYENNFFTEGTVILPIPKVRITY